VIAVFFAGLTLYMFVMMLKENRKKKFNRALSSAISVLVKMMKNGIGFEQALAKSIEVSSCSMFKSLFKDFFAEKNTIGEMAAFENIYKHVDSKELRIFALAIKIGRESGGQFSNTLAKVEQTINYRKKMQDKVDVLTREGNFGSYVVIGIAILLYIMINANFDGRVHQFFMESEFGRFELLGIITWVFFGMLANKLVTKVDK
jgi:tight adherence protein B